MPSTEFDPEPPATKRLHTYALGYGYIGARTDTTQQTNICLVATFNPTCVSRLIAMQGLLVLTLLIVSDVNGT